MIVYTQVKNQPVRLIDDALYYRGNTFFNASACECCGKTLIEDANPVTIVTKFNDIEFYQRNKIDATDMYITDQYTINDDGYVICLDCEV